MAAARRVKLIVRGTAAALVCAVAALTLTWLPSQLAPMPSKDDLVLIRDPAKRIELVSAARKLQNDVRATGLQAIAGVVLAIGAVATWRQLQLGRRELSISLQGQITERFTRSVDQLGNDSVDVRTGGIYALARIAKDSPQDATAIAQILAAYVKVHSPWHPSAKTQPAARNLRPLRARAPDVQAAMSVLGTMDLTDQESSKGPVDHYRFGLGGVDLSFADLRRLNLRNVWLAESNLTRVELQGTDLRDASLWKSKLTSALLADADLRGADLRQADMRQAWMQNTRLARIKTDEQTDLEGADTSGASYGD